MDLQETQGPPEDGGIPKKYRPEANLPEKTDQDMAPEPERRVGDPENPLDDMWQNVKDMTGAVSQVTQGYWDLATKSDYRDEWKKGWADLMSGKYHREVGNHLWKGLKEQTVSHWTNPEGNFDLGYTLMHHPVSALMDLAVAKDIAGGGAKMFGRMAGGRNVAEMTANELKALGPLTKADKVVQYGQKALDTHIDPFQLAGKAIGKSPVGQWVQRELGFGPETKNITREIAEEVAKVNLETEMKAKLLMESELGAGSSERIFNALDRGSEADYKALQPNELDFIDRYRAGQGKLTSPKYKEIAEALPDREANLKQRGFIPAESEEVLAKQAALRNWGEGNVTKQNIAEALEKIRSGEWSPTYRHLGHESEHEYSMLEQFLQDVRGDRPKMGGPTGVPQLNRRTGMGTGYTKDALVNGVKQVIMEGQFDRKIRVFDRVMNYLQRRGLIREVDAAGNIPKGFAIIPGEVWQKYMIQEKRAAGLAFAEGAKGLNPMTAGSKAYEKFVLDPKLLEDVAGKKVYAVPDYVANYMKFHLAIPGPIARSYDKVFRYWKGMATVLRPQYWMNVVAGNGFLSALHGVTPMDAARYYRNMHLLPPELRAISQVSDGIWGATRYQQAVNTLKNWDSMVHTHLTKGPGFAHEVEAIRLQARDTAKNLNDVGQKFFVAADILDDADKFYQLVAQSPEKMSQAIQQHVAIREQIAQRVPAIITQQEKADEALRTLNELWRDARQKYGTANRAQFPPNVRMALNDAGRAHSDLLQELSGLKEDYLQLAVQEGHVRASMPELQRISDWAEKAIGPVNELEGAYNRLHPLEKSWISRAVPFYPWTKAMTKLAFMMPFLYPKSTFMWNRFNEMMQSLTSQDEHLPEYLQGAIHVGVTADGAHVFVKPFWDPFRGERPGSLGGVAMPGIVADLAKQHPLLKFMHDIVGGVDTFTMKPFEPGEAMTRTDTGEVYKLDPKTKQWVRTLAQPSVWRKLWGLFPASQMIDTFFLPHVQTANGWAGSPDPVRDNSGEPMYPIPFYQRLIRSIGVPVTYQTEDQKDAADKKQRKLFQQYRNDIRRMPPEKQDAAIRVLEDATR